MILQVIQRLRKTRQKQVIGEYRMLCAFCMKVEMTVTIKSVDDTPTLHACDSCAALSPKERTALFRKTLEERLINK
jgi:hypothetical protein